jgi:hypothetical protein
MRDARRFSAREVSHGVQRHVLAQTTWSGSTVVAHSGAVPLVLRASTPGPARRIRDEARRSPWTARPPSGRRATVVGRRSVSRVISRLISAWL